MPELFEIGLQDMIACVEREIRMRTQVYPRRVAERKMRQSEADREIACMRAVLMLIRLTPKAPRD